MDALPFACWDALALSQTLIAGQKVRVCPFVSLALILLHELLVIGLLDSLDDGGIRHGSLTELRQESLGGECAGFLLDGHDLIAVIGGGTATPSE